MAKPEHVALLKEGVDRWNEWRLSSDERPDLRGEDLREAQLNSANLRDSDLRSANLRGTNLFRADLARANLSGANLTKSGLDWANLAGAKLTGASLYRARLWRAILSKATLDDVILNWAMLAEADLSGASLKFATLTGVKLSAAKLNGATLFGATLNSAIVEDADFTGGSVGFTAFVNLDLRAAKGLDTLVHDGPSSIGIDTLYRSSGSIPEAFLRGAGIPENFITYSNSLVEKPCDFYSCFISYSHADRPFARRLHDGLQSRGVRCWLDEKQLLPGDDIYDHVDRGIRLWDKVLLCCSQHSLTSWWVDDEIGKAFAKEQELMKARQKKIHSLIPLDLDGYLFSGWKNGKASNVRERLAADFKDWDKNDAKFEEQIEKVARALRADSAAREEPPPPKL